MEKKNGSLYVYDEHKETTPFKDIIFLKMLKISIFMVPTRTGKPGNGKTFSSRGILHRLEKSRKFGQNTGKVGEI